MNLFIENVQLRHFKNIEIVTTKIPLRGSKKRINLYFLLTKLGTEGARQPLRLRPIVASPFSRISVQMLDGTVFHGHLEESRLSLPPPWISSPGILNSRDILNPIRAYVRMPDGTGMIARLREEHVLDHFVHPAPLIAVSSIIQLRNGTSSRAVLSLFRIRNNARVRFSTSGTSVFVGFPEGLIFTGMYGEV